MPCLVQVNFREGRFDNEFLKEEIVFLTADSPNVLNGTSIYS